MRNSERMTAQMGRNNKDDDDNNNNNNTSEYTIVQMKI